LIILINLNLPNNFIRSKTNTMAQQKLQTNALSYCMDLIGGKWKPIILFHISKGINRFNKLFNEIEGINRQMLSKQLKELEKSGILERTLFPEIPPRVEYTLTPLGKSLMTVVQAMNRWGQKQQEEVKVTKKKDTQQATLFE
jgi:DNA-binding HxlR family transcriptional regulator